MKNFVISVILATTTLVGFSQVDSSTEKNMVILINGIRSNPTSFVKALKEYNKDSSYSSNCDKSVNALINKLNATKSVSTLVECDFIHNVSKKYVSTLEDNQAVSDINDTTFNKRMTSINANCIS